MCEADFRRQRWSHKVASTRAQIVSFVERIAADISRADRSDDEDNTTMICKFQKRVLGLTTDVSAAIPAFVSAVRSPYNPEGVHDAML